mmetsp:Transcript_109048/g.281866  ORF Transcript_109048/g.281866 Transcript_109048/m.281866 type:complete len:215 (+) Transcript_109048:3255-3899(+)
MTERMPSAVASIPIMLPSLDVECLFSPRIDMMNMMAEVKEKSPTCVARAWPAAASCSARKPPRPPKPLRTRGRAAAGRPDEDAAAGPISRGSSAERSAESAGAAAEARRRGARGASCRERGCSARAAEVPATAFVAALSQAVTTCSSCGWLPNQAGTQSSRNGGSPHERAPSRKPPGARSAASSDASSSPAPAATTRAGAPGAGDDDRESREKR